MVGEIKEFGLMVSVKYQGRNLTWKVVQISQGRKFSPCKEESRGECAKGKGGIEEAFCIVVNKWDGEKQSVYKNF